MFGDAAYTSDEYKHGERRLGMRWCVNDMRKPNKKLSSKQKKRNRKQSAVRARVEHIFRIIKCQFGFHKTRYRSLEKNASQVNFAGRLSQPVPAQEAIERRLGVNPPKVSGKPDKPPETARQIWCADFKKVKTIGQSRDHRFVQRFIRDVYL